MTKSERISNILFMKRLKKTNTLTYFDSNVNRDGTKEENVAKTVFRIKF